MYRRVKKLIFCYYGGAFIPALILLANIPPGLASPLHQANADSANRQQPANTAATPASAPPSEDEELIAVKKIAVTGNTIVDSKRISAIVRPLEGKSVTYAALEKATRAISDLYLRAGYITSRAVLDEDSIGEDTVKIKVIEAAIQAIKVEGNHHLNSNYISSRIQRGIGRPLNANKLEQQLRLLRIDPALASVDASLQPGRGEGQSVLVVRVKEAKQFGTSFSFDNYTPPSIAPERATIGAKYRDLLGMGMNYLLLMALGRI